MHSVTIVSNSVSIFSLTRNENTFNPIITLLAGMSDIMLCIFLACMPSKKKAIIPVGIFMIYNIPTFLIGQRTPIVISALFIFSYFVIRDYLNNKERWIGKFEKIALILLMTIIKSTATIITIVIEVKILT